MTAPTRLLEAMFRLPPALTRRVTAHRDIAVPTRDGFHLLTDHYAPAVGSAPTVLVRTPYGRRGAMAVLGRVFAERGFHVVLQSCRGTCGSTGVFEPLLYERADGMDTLDWLRRQPWYSGAFGMFGASYLGFVQWAIAADAGDELKALVAVVTASQTRDSTYSGGAFALDTVLTWAELMEAQTVPWWSRQMELKRGQPRLRRALDHLPLREADRVATGGTVTFFQEWLAHAEAGQPRLDYWQRRVHDHRLAEVTAPVAMVTGWHDIFLPAQLADYQTLRATGARPQLTIGPWTHGSMGLFVASLREGLAWFMAHLGGDPSGLREAPVRLYVDGGHAGDGGGDGGHAGDGGGDGGHASDGGGDGDGRGGGGGGWRDLPDWPLETQLQHPWYLHPGGALHQTPPAPSTPDHFRYDPADPTPSVGGALLVAKRAGRVDNRAIEARPDVLTYTSAALTAAIEAAGPVEATVYVRSELDHYDVFVRLCDVDTAGRSWNVCDGLIRVSPGRFDPMPDGVQAVRVELWPTAYRFQPGHRIRLQVSGGAHPRYARNPGTGEPLGTATTLRAGDRWVYHDPRHPSVVVLPGAPR